MAEAILAPETEVTPPNDDALLTPDSTTESAPPADNQEEDTSHIDAFLEGLGSDDAAQVGDDGKAATPDGTVPAPQNLTPEEAREQGRREKEAELETQRTSQERQRYIEGLNFVVQDVPAKLTALAVKYGFDPADTTELMNQLNRFNGAYKPLYEHAVQQATPQVRQQAYQEAEASVSQHLLAAVTEDLGDAAGKAITGEIGKSIKTWPDMAKAIAKEARKGFVPQADLTKAQRKVLDKIDTALKGRGMSLRDITGNGGSDLPPIRGGGGTIANSYDNDRAYNEGRITSEQWKANTDRFKAQENR